MTVPQHLESWFSSDRLTTYAGHTDPVAFYEWNSRLSAAYFEVIGHTEVLLRNRIASALRPSPTGQPWYLNPRYNFSAKTTRQINDARGILTSKGRPETVGGVVAELSFGFWRFLLTKRHAPDVWVDLVASGLPHFPHGTDRAAFAHPVEQIHKLRNRIAHLEPLVDTNAAAEARRLDRYDTHLDTLARWIDPAAATWITSVSRVGTVRNQRP